MNAMCIFNYDDSSNKCRQQFEPERRQCTVQYRHAKLGSKTTIFGKNDDSDDSFYKFVSINKFSYRLKGKTTPFEPTSVVILKGILARWKYFTAREGGKKGGGMIDHTKPKTCSKCGTLKEAEEFEIIGKRKDGAVRRCAACQSCRKNVSFVSFLNEAQAKAVRDRAKQSAASTRQWKTRRLAR